MESILPKENLVIGVIGAGAMGRGIAQVAATGGMTVLLTDSRPEAVADAVKSIEKALARLKEKGTIDQGAMDRALGRIKPVQSVEQFAECRLVIEAVIDSWRDTVRPPVGCGGTFDFPFVLTSGSAVGP